MRDRAADDFEVFYAAAFPRLTIQFRPLVGGDAEEVVQEAFVRAYERWSKVGTYDNPEAWVWHVANRLATSRWRASLRLRSLVPKIGTAQSEAENADAVDAAMWLAAALRKLPPSQRTSLALFYLADLPISEVAARLGTSEGNVKAHLSRGRQRLGALLQAEDRWTTSTA